MWRIRTRMPFPRSGMAFGSDGRLIYMTGGEYLDNAYVGVFRNLEAYDPARDQWYELPPMTFELLLCLWLLFQGLRSPRTVLGAAQG